MAARLHVLAAAMLAAAPACALAQAEVAYPVKPVRLIVPSAPGGSTDILSRYVAQHLGETWRAQVVVENRAGASGNIGMELVAKSAPDGYTLVMGYVGTLSVNPSIFPKLPYDPLKDYAPVTLVALVPNMLAVHPSVPARSVKELVALAKARPGQLNYGSAGSGSNSHLSVEYFKQLTRTDIVQIAYKGAGNTMVDLLGGHISLTIVGVPPLLPHVKAGKLRALGVSTPARLAILPDVPTIQEAGVPGYDVTQWYGIVAPAGTPREIVRKLHAEIGRFLKLPEAAARMSAEGAIPTGNTPEEFQQLIRTETVRWAKVIKAAGA
jgi:tripartite-type tricarboxylate transporter receptor subunit TctC